MDWRLRRAGEADAAALSLVAGATFLETYFGILSGADIVQHCAEKNSAAAFARTLADDRAIVTLADHVPGGAPVGFTVLTKPNLPVPTAADDIELLRIYALAHTHGSGLGAALMERAMEDARALGRTRIFVGFYGGNDRARRFYEKHGFAFAGTRQFQVGTSLNDDLIYARPL